MKIKENYMIRAVAGQNIVVPLGDAAADFNGMVTLNDTGAFLWGKMDKQTDERSLVEALLAEYDVSEELATEGVRFFVMKMREANLIDE